MGESKPMGGLGFRDLHAFNKPLLAKQLWRLFKSPTSLVAFILKYKYFRNCSIYKPLLVIGPRFYGGVFWLPLIYLKMVWVGKLEMEVLFIYRRTDGSLR